MNKIDIANIQKIIRQRQTSVFKKGGELEIDFLMSLETSELIKMEKEFKSEKFKKDSERFKSIVKNIFDNYGKPEDNILILSECYGDYDGGRELYGIGDDEFSDPTTFSEIERGKDNLWAQSVKIPGDDNVIQENYKDIWNLMKELDIPHATYFFSEDESVNCYWHGFIAVNRGFEIVSFVCEECGEMMMDDDIKNPSTIIKKL